MKIEYYQVEKMARMANELTKVGEQLKLLSECLIGRWIDERKGKNEYDWNDFIEFLRAQQQLVYAAFARRLSVVKFADGELIIKGGKFDVSCLADPTITFELTALIHQFTNRTNWTISWRISE